MMETRFPAAACVIAVTMSGGALAAPQSCESLASLQLPDTTITVAAVVAAGAFDPPGATPPIDTQRAASPARSRPPATRASRSKCGCPQAVGTASSSRLAKAALPVRSTMAALPMRCAGGMPAAPLTLATWEAMPIRAWPSAEGDRLRLARQAPAGRALQGHHPRPLRPRREARLLQLLLQRWPPGVDGGSALRQRLRRRAGRRTGQRLDASVRGIRLERTGTVEHAGRVSADQQAHRRAGRHACIVRCARRRGRRRGRGPAPLQVRPGDPRLPGRHRRARLPHAAAGGRRAQDHGRPAQPGDRPLDLPGLLHQRRRRVRARGRCGSRARRCRALRCRASSATPSSVAWCTRFRRPRRGTSRPSTSMAT